MRLELESTNETVFVNMPYACRIWKGRSAGGTEVIAYVAIVAARNDADKGDLELELAEITESVLSGVVTIDPPPK